MPCNGDDNDADMAIFLHGRQARADFVHILHIISSANISYLKKYSSEFGTFID